MDNPILLAFITGLTTGGLSCMAVQGGLLATSLAHQLELDMLKPPPANTAQHKRGPGSKIAQRRRSKTNTALPIALFLLAKLIAYTLLGALLGWVGSYLTLSPTTRAILMIAIGVFMIGNGLRMLNVHPIFRYFNLEPPKAITRYIRKTARNGTELVTPLFLGALTIFIPCGVTQAMMAAALGTGSAVEGAALMFAFTLGTSVLFFAVAYAAAEIGARMEKFFMTFVAIVVLVVGLFTLNSGLNLMGSPISYQNLARSLFTVEQASSTNPAGNFAEAAGPLAPASEDGELVLQVKNNGYFPARLNAKAGEALTLKLVTENTVSCSRDFVIPDLDYYVLLPQSGEETVEIPAQEAGTVMRFTCSMGMYTGEIVFGN